MAKKSQAVKLVEQSENTAPQVEPAFFDSELFWRVGGALVLLAAIVLRFYELGLKPFHHDEGVNGFFLTNLVRNGVYKYDPSNYHGPTLYFAAQASSYLFGLNDFAVRFVTAFFGVLTVAGVLYLRRYLGSVGALAAAGFVALSPGMVFISRYFIHEMLFVFFTLGVVLGILKFFERERAGQLAVGLMAFLLLVCLLPGTVNFAEAVGGGDWQTRNYALIGFFALEALIVFLLAWLLINWQAGRPIYLMLASAALVLTFATKETAFISFGTMLIALGCLFIWQKAVGQGERVRGQEEKVKDTLEKSVSHSLHPSPIHPFTPLDLGVTALLCALIFTYVGALYFSSFFTYQQGINAAFEAYAFWSKTGSKDHTANGLFAYIKWLWRIEAAILLLAVFGALTAFWKSKHRFAMFAALWAFGLLAAYTLIPYKTPWLAVNFVLPLCIIAGYGINELAVSREAWRRGGAAFLTVAAFGWCAYQSAELNFYQYDNNDKPYVYAHTKRDFLNLVQEIKRVAEASGRGKEASILIVSPEYWALPWYLRDYPGAAFYGQIQPASTAEMIVGSTAQSEELKEEYEKHYTYIATFALRPNVDLMLYARKDVAQKMAGK